MKESANTSLSGSLQPPTSRAAKRQSINPAMAFDPSAFMEPSQKRSSVASVNSNRSGSYRSASDSLGRDSPHVQSPLRDGFQNDMPLSPHGPLEKSGAAFPSSTSPVDLFQQRGRAGSSSHLDNSLSSRPSLHPSDASDHLPQNGVDATVGSALSPLDRNSPGRPDLNGRLSPLASSNRNSSILVHADRPPFSPTYSVNGRLSPNTGNASPVSPTSPNHRVDVPTGVESESDQESDDRAGMIDSPGIHSTPLSDDDTIPALPPKSSREYKRPRPPSLNIQSPASSTTIAENVPDGLEVADSEEPSGSEISHESSPVQQTSHSTFIAPALPPIRFSMSGSDFGDFMGLGGQDSQRSAHPKRTAASVPEVAEDSSEDIVTPVDESDKHIPPVSTPKSDKTIIGADATPRKNGILMNSVPSPSMNSLLLAEPPVPVLTRSTSTRWNPKGLKASSPRRRRASEADETPRAAAPTKFDASRSDSAMQSPVSDRVSSDSDQKPVEKPGSRGRLDSTVSVRFAQPTPEAQKLDAARKLRTDTSDLVGRRLQEALENAADRGAPHMKFDREFVEAIATMVEQRKEEYLDMKKKLDGLKVSGRTIDHLVSID